MLQFVGELESSLLDFNDGWGGGSVSLRNMLTLSPHQVQMLKNSFFDLSEFRKKQTFFSCFVRMNVLIREDFHKPPDVAAADALRASKNADYLSSHLSFTRRICNIAEKLFHAEVEKRKATLQNELVVLNVSGAMGGDPLNRVSENHTRVVRISATEGHVFRSNFSN